MIDASPWNVSQAVLADAIVAKKRGRQAHETVIVQGDDDGKTIGGQSSDCRGRESRNEVMEVNHVASMVSCLMNGILSCRTRPYCARGGT